MLVALHVPIFKIKHCCCFFVAVLGWSDDRRNNRWLHVRVHSRLYQYLSIPTSLLPAEVAHSAEKSKHSEHEQHRDDYDVRRLQSVSRRSSQRNGLSRGQLRLANQ